VQYGPSANRPRAYCTLRSAAHPGGGVTGVTGAPGHNAARQIIRDFKRPRFPLSPRAGRGSE
jgi:hypothetical protein